MRRRVHLGTGPRARGAGDGGDPRSAGSPGSTGSRSFARRARAVRTAAGVRLSVAAGGDDGSAIVEFLGVALLLLVPVVYLALTLGRLQAATFAVDGAAREAARAVVTATDATSAEQRVIAAVGLALADQGVDADPAAATSVACDSDCLAPGTAVTVRVATDVPLPGTGWLQGAIPVSVPVSATATSVRDSWVAAGEAAE